MSFTSSYCLGDPRVACLKRLTLSLLLESGTKQSLRVERSWRKAYGANIVLH